MPNLILWTNFRILGEPRALPVLIRHDSTIDFDFKLFIASPARAFRSGSQLRAHATVVRSLADACETGEEAIWSWPASLGRLHDRVPDDPATGRVLQDGCNFIAYLVRHGVLARTGVGLAALHHVAAAKRRHDAMVSRLDARDAASMWSLPTSKEEEDDD